MKRILKILGITVILILLFQSAFYKLFVSYKFIATQKGYLLKDSSLISRIDKNIEGKPLTLQNIADITLDLTTNTLTFRENAVSSNPNTLVKQKKAHCVGYASMYNSISNYLIKEYDLSEKYQSIHCRGHLYFLGYNLHQHTPSSFWSNHDYNLLIDKISKDTLAIDPSLADYSFISRVEMR